MGTDGKHYKKTVKKETVTINNVETVKHFVGTEEHAVPALQWSAFSLVDMIDWRKNFSQLATHN